MSTFFHTFCIFTTPDNGKGGNSNEYHLEMRSKDILCVLTARCEIALEAVNNDFSFAFHGHFQIKSKLDFPYFKNFYGHLGMSSMMAFYYFKISSLHGADSNFI